MQTYIVRVPKILSRYLVLLKISSLASINYSIASTNLKPSWHIPSGKVSLDSLILYPKS